MIGVNNKVLCKPYLGSKGLKSEIKHGLATIVQKTRLIGLEVLMDSKLSDGTLIEKGNLAFLKEEDLCTHHFANQKLNIEGIEGELIVIPGEFIVCIK